MILADCSSTDPSGQMHQCCPHQANKDRDNRKCEYEGDEMSLSLKEDRPHHTSGCDPLEAEASLEGMMASILFRDDDTCTSRYSASSHAPTVASVPAFHQGMDKDELMSMVATLTTSTAFEQALKGIQAAVIAPSKPKRRGSFCTTCSQTVVSTAVSTCTGMPSLADCSCPCSVSEANSVSEVGCSSVKEEEQPNDGPVTCINKNQLFAMRRYQKGCPDKRPSLPTRMRCPDDASEAGTACDSHRCTHRGAGTSTGLEAESEDLIKNQLVALIVAMGKQQQLEKFCPDHTPSPPARQRSFDTGCSSCCESEGSVASPLKRERWSSGCDGRRCCDSIPHQPRVRATWAESDLGYDVDEPRPTQKCSVSPKTHVVEHASARETPGQAPSLAKSDRCLDEDFPDPSPAKQDSNICCPMSRFFIKIWKRARQGGKGKTNKFQRESTTAATEVLVTDRTSDSSQHNELPGETDIENVWDSMVNEMDDQSTNFPTSVSV